MFVIVMVIVIMIIFAILVIVMIVVAVMMMPFIVLVIIIVSFRRRTKSRSDAEYDKSDKCVFHFAVSLWDGFPTAPNFNGKIGSDTRQRPQDPTEVVCSRGVPLVACCPYNAASEFLDLGATHRRCPLLRLGEGNEIAVTALSSNAIFASTTVTSAVGQYSISGTLLNTNFITLSSPGGAGSLAVLGNNLFLENGGEYNASTGDLINANFGVGGQLAVSGDYLFALNGQNLVEYDIAGTVISDHLLGITPEYLAVVSVPEPCTWMMLSVGLLLGTIFVAERHRQPIRIQDFLTK